MPDLAKPPKSLSKNTSCFPEQRGRDRRYVGAGYAAGSLSLPLKVMECVAAALSYTALATSLGPQKGQAKVAALGKQLADLIGLEEVASRSGLFALIALGLSDFLKTYRREIITGVSALIA